MYLNGPIKNHIHLQKFLDEYFLQIMKYCILMRRQLQLLLGDRKSYVRIKLMCAPNQILEFIELKLL